MTGATPMTAADSSGADFLTLAASDLDGFGANSLLIGGTRTASGSGFSIDPTTDGVFLENDADHLNANETAVTLQGNEIILVSKENLTVDSGASIQTSSSAAPTSGTEVLTIGSASTPGDGVLLAVSNNSNIELQRSDVTSDSGPNLQVGTNGSDGASISGVAVILDSTSATTIDSNTQFDQAPGVKGQTLIVGSGTISLQVGASATPPSSRRVWCC